MNNASDRRTDRDRRKSIDEYRRLAEEVATNAVKAKDGVTQKQYLLLAKSLTDMANTLQARQSNPQVLNTPTI